MDASPKQCSGLAPCNRGWDFLVCVAAAALVDGWLVWHKYPTLSERIWAACEAHPTLIAAGLVATVAVAYVVRRSWLLAAFAGLIGGHLFVHW